MNSHYREISPARKQKAPIEYKDPLGYATNKLSSLIDKLEDTNNRINNTKLLIKVYFSDEVQMDETPMGAMRRNQIRKELLQFADK
jgi:hypothetical protein